MSNTQPGLPTARVTVKLHQLCKYCQALTKDLVRVFPILEDGETALICKHYGSLQDLLDGTLGGCHLCNIAYDAIKRDCMQRSIQIPSWLQSPTPKEMSDEQVPKTKIITGATLNIHDLTHLRLETSDGALYRGKILINYWDLSSTPIVSYTETQLSAHVASNAHYHLINRWLDACTDVAQHPACNTTNKFRAPTRLLDLDYHYKHDCKGLRQDVRLVEGRSSTGKYAALSYSWGAVQQLKLLRINLEQFQERIAFEELSPVTKDAIAVCRRLSIPYLWVDALCIIQENDGDFMTEAPRMQDVYAGSTLTIVAADSKDTTEAFLAHRNPLPWLQCILESQIENRGSTCFVAESGGFCKGREMRNIPGNYHIDSRAWCFQERFMSPRSISFGQKGIHWECRQGLACEFEMDISKENCTAESTRSRLKHQHAKLQSMNLVDGSSILKARGIWNDLVEAYSETSLSHSEDVLIAIAGVASIFEAKLKSKSTYGLWVEHILSELLWRYRRPDTAH